MTSTGQSPDAPAGVVSRVLSVNVGSARPSRHATTGVTGIDKRPVDAIEVFAPGPKVGGAGSGVHGDFIGDRRHHGGDAQAVYAVARADLDHYEGVLGRRLPNGWMGENLTVVGVVPEAAVVGERWRVGGAELQVTCPRIPCKTFQGWAGRAHWIREFTATGRCGTYLAVLRPGRIHPGDAIEVLSVPDHGVTVRDLFWALTIRPELAADVLAAGSHLTASDRERLERRETLRPS